MSKRILLLAAALWALAACEKASQESVAPETAPENETPWILKNLFDEAEPASGAPRTFGADFGGTRAHIDMNAEGTYAQSVWKAGDKIIMYAFNQSTGQYRYDVLSTSQSGPSVEFETPGSLEYAGPYYTVFPDARKFSLYEGQVIIGTSIPAEQEAVPGGIHDGYTVAYVTAQRTDEFLHFKNKVSLVRFRMSGSIASQVKSVTVKGATNIAGDIVLLVGSDGEATVTDQVWFNPDGRSNTVRLSGDFVAGQDYFIVLKPGAQTSFKMVFADDAGHSTTKVGQAFTFPEGRISDFGTIDLGDEFQDDNTVYDPIQYMAATAGAPKPVTIAVIGDGFTKSELSDFEMLAKSGVDALMNTEPYKTYRNYFNVWILKAASRESGANVTDGSGTIVTPVNCYFGSRWGRDSYDDMVANESDVYDFVAENCPDIKNGIHTINEVPILLVINDARYGGRCHSVSDGKGYAMAPYTDHGGPLSWQYASFGKEAASATAAPGETRQVTEAERQALGISNGNWLNVLVHEFGGHCFGRLDDEYWHESTKPRVSEIGLHSWPVPYALNISASYDNPTWKAALLGDDLQAKPSLVAKDSRYGRIGVYQGGDVSVFNRWRSEKVSCMIDNRFYFSTWQRMIIVKRIMSLSGSAYSEASFWEHDNPADPLRDAVSGQTQGKPRLPRRVMPMLPPPVLHEVD